MKKIISILLACLLILSMAVPASAAVSPMADARDVAIQYSLEFDGKHNITAKQGDTITVTYYMIPILPEGTQATVSSNQNQITFDKDFLEFQSASVTKDIFTNSNHLDNTPPYIYYNSGTSFTVKNSSPIEIGTMTFKVKAVSGITKVLSTTNFAQDSKETFFGKNNLDLTITISGSGSSTETKAVTGISLNKTNTTLQAGAADSMMATIIPADAANKAMTWSSSNEAVATVDAKGNVNAKSAGTATITATTADGGKTASCTVTVTANAEETTPETPAEETPGEETVPETPSIAFTDVKKTNYFYDAVLWAVENEVTLGKTATLFDPSGSITRAQAVTFLWRAAGCPVVNYAMSFTDVEAGAYYAEAVRWAVAEGITNGTTSSTFSPNATCTRGQIVSFLYRYAKASPVGTGNPFTDVKTGAYYYDAVLWAVSKGITGGTTASTFAPKNTCSRAQVVTFLYRYMGK